MKKVVHLIPYYGIGGVETAAGSMKYILSDGLEFRIETIISSSNATHPFKKLNPLIYMAAVWRLWCAAPSMLVVSLWKSCIVGLVIKLFRPKLRLVLFLHFPDDVHGLDRFFTRVAGRIAYRIWADSYETLVRRIPKLQADKGRVISFVTARIQPLPAHFVTPVFVFWGRIHAQKGLERALRLFAKVQCHQSGARFLVIGPDGGDLARIRGVVNMLGLNETVQFLGGMDFEMIKMAVAGSSFYLQTSELEGMGMSVVEAMQLGLVPIVTPVGEIANYTRHGENAIVITDNEAVVSKVLEMINDNQCYQKMRQHAIATWTNQPLYKDSVLSACREVLEMEKVN